MQALLKSGAAALIATAAFSLEPASAQTAFPEKDEPATTALLIVTSGHSITSIETAISSKKDCLLIAYNAARIGSSVVTCKNSSKEVIGGYHCRIAEMNTAPNCRSTMP